MSYSMWGGHSYSSENQPPTMSSVNEIMSQAYNYKTFSTPPCQNGMIENAICAGKVNHPNFGKRPRQHGGQHIRQIENINLSIHQDKQLQYLHENGDDLHDCGTPSTDDQYISTYTYVGMPSISPVNCLSQIQANRPPQFQGQEDSLQQDSFGNASEFYESDAPLEDNEYISTFSYVGVPSTLPKARLSQVSPECEHLLQPHGHSFQQESQDNNSDFDDSETPLAEDEYLSTYTYIGVSPPPMMAGPSKPVPSQRQEQPFQYPDFQLDPLVGSITGQCKSSTPSTPRPYKATSVVTCDEASADKSLALVASAAGNDDITREMVRLKEEIPENLRRLLAASEPFAEPIAGIRPCNTIIPSFGSIKVAQKSKASHNNTGSSGNGDDDQWEEWQEAPYNGVSKQDVWDWQEDSNLIAFESPPAGRDKAAQMLNKERVQEQAQPPNAVTKTTISPGKATSSLEVIMAELQPLNTAFSPTPPSVTVEHSHFWGQQLKLGLLSPHNMRRSNRPIRSTISTPPTAVVPQEPFFHLATCHRVQAARKTELQRKYGDEICASLVTNSVPITPSWLMAFWVARNPCPLSFSKDFKSYAQQLAALMNDMEEPDALQIHADGMRLVREAQKTAREDDSEFGDHDDSAMHVNEFSGHDQSSGSANTSEPMKCLARGWLKRLPGFCHITTLDEESLDMAEDQQHYKEEVEKLGGPGGFGDWEEYLSDDEGSFAANSITPCEFLAIASGARRRENPLLEQLAKALENELETITSLTPAALLEPTLATSTSIDRLNIEFIKYHMVDDNGDTRSVITAPPVEDDPEPKPQPTGIPCSRSFSRDMSFLAYQRMAPDCVRLLRDMRMGCVTGIGYPVLDENGRAVPGLTATHRVHIDTRTRNESNGLFNIISIDTNSSVDYAKLDSVVEFFEHGVPIASKTAKKTKAKNRSKIVVAPALEIPSEGTQYSPRTHMLLSRRVPSATSTECEHSNKLSNGEGVLSDSDEEFDDELSVSCKMFTPGQNSPRNESPVLSVKFDTEDTNRLADSIKSSSGTRQMVGNESRHRQKASAHSQQKRKGEPMAQPFTTSTKSVFPAEAHESFCAPLSAPLFRGIVRTPSPQIMPAVPLLKENTQKSTMKSRPRPRTPNSSIKSLSAIIREAHGRERHFQHRIVKNESNPVTQTLGPNAGTSMSVSSKFPDENPPEVSTLEAVSKQNHDGEIPETLQKAVAVNVTSETADFVQHGSDVKTVGSVKHKPEATFKSSLKHGTSRFVETGLCSTSPNNVLHLAPISESTRTSDLGKKPSKSEPHVRFDLPLPPLPHEKEFSQFIKKRRHLLQRARNDGYSRIAGDNESDNEYESATEDRNMQRGRSRDRLEGLLTKLAKPFHGIGRGGPRGRSRSKERERKVQADTSATTHTGATCGTGNAKHEVCSTNHSKTQIPLEPPPAKSSRPACEAVDEHQPRNMSPARRTWRSLKSTIGGGRGAVSDGTTAALDPASFYSHGNSHLDPSAIDDDTDSGRQTHHDTYIVDGHNNSTRLSADDFFLAPEDLTLSLLSARDAEVERERKGKRSKTRTRTVANGTVPHVRGGATRKGV